MRCRIPTLTCDAAVGSHFHYGSTSEYMNEKRAYEELVLMLESDVVTHFLQKKGNILMVVESAEQHFNNDGGFYYPFNGTFPAARRGLSEEVFQAHGGQKGAWPVIYDAIPYGWEQDILQKALQRVFRITPVALSASPGPNVDVMSLTHKNPTMLGRIAYIPLFELSGSRPDIHGLPTDGESKNVLHFYHWHQIQRYQTK
eukprot:m.791947 g.791947  ORF g.791947 m.791947 type:complete len:200 (-) comp23331_c0_seq32:453-1052(-)